MKKFLGLVFILTLFLTGCVDKGNLQIINNTSEDVWYQVNYGTTEWLDPGESDSYSWDLSTSIFGEEDKKVIVTYGGGEWFWYDNYEVVKTIKPGKTSNVDVIADKGSLEITSNSSEDVWYQLDYGTTQWLNPGESDSYSWLLDLSTILFKEITVMYGGGEWFWYETYEVNKTIYPGSTANVEIIGDSGEIMIINDTSETNIMSIYISPSSSPDWGNDLLGNDILYPDYYISWLVTTGLWDIRLIDENDYEYFFWEEQINPETLYEYSFTDAKRSSDSIGEKITNSQKYTEKVEGKCRRK